MTTSTYIAGRGILYQLDARSKLLLVLLLCIEVFLPISQGGLWILFVVTFLTAWHATGFKQAVQPLRSIAFILVVMTLLAPITYREGAGLLSIGEHMVVTYEAVYHLGLLMARFLGITYICTLYVWTTPMAEINLALRWYGLPYHAALVLTLAFRFIPFIADSFRMIQDSHALRESVQIEGRTSRMQRLSDIIPTVTAALVFALKSIPYLAMSLEHRGLGRSTRRSSFRQLKAKGGLFTQLVVSVMIPTVFWFLFTTL